MNQELFVRPIAPLYRKYLIPTLVAMLSNSLYCLVDVYFISIGSGSAGLAAVNIAMPIYTMYSCIGLIFGVGASTIMSIAYGAKDDAMRNRAFTMSIWMMLGIGLLFTVIGSIFLKEFAYALGASEELLPYVLQYMRPVHMVAFIFILMYSSSLLLRADHNPSLAMKAMLIGNISNMILDYVFVMVFQMGISGAAIATAISPCLTVGISLLHFIRRKNTVHFVKDWFSLELLKRMFMNGLGSGVMEISAGMVILIFNSVILSIGNELTLAAYAIITNIAYVCKGLLNGFAQAAQPILSSNYGAGKQDRVRQALHCSLWYAGGFALLVYAIFLCIPKLICMPFASGDAHLIEVAANGVRLYFSSLLFLAVNTMMMYYFQSLERGKLSTFLAIGKGVVFVLLGLAILVPFFHMNGVWLSITFAECLCTLVAMSVYLLQNKSLREVFNQYRKN